jgi:hypothetical protein
MNNKFLKDQTNNCFDWFNLNGTFEDIFHSRKEFELTENEIKSNNTTYFIWKPLSIECLIKNDPNLPPGEFSKFHYLTLLRFGGIAKDAYSFVEYELKKNEFPFCRVGVDYYKNIVKKNRYGCEVSELKQWNKIEIKDDHKGQFSLLKKYDDFTIEPDNINYKQSINGFYNQYPKFCHEPVDWYVTQKDIPYTIKLLKHLFGNQYEYGLKYMNVLYKHPAQAQYILCFVSEENNTGKTTFIDFLQMIFANASIQIPPSSLGQHFNYIYSTKNLILIEEAVTEKTQTVETLKALSTQKFITVNRKNVSEYEVPFFGKFVMCTNKVDDFIRINDKETRFWVRKVEPIAEEDRLVNIGSLLFDEIPMFLKYLLQMKKVDLNRHRMVFLPEEIETIWTKAVKKESYSGLHKQIYLLFREFFNDNMQFSEVYCTDIDIKERWFSHNNNIGIEYIRKTIKNDFKKKPEQKRYLPFNDSAKNTKNQRAFLFSASDFGVVFDGEDEDVPF